MSKNPAFKRTKKIGRPSKFSPEVQDKIVGLIRAGNYIETAAAIAGISKETFYDWMKQGADPKSRFAPFSDAVVKASAEAEAMDLLLIGQAARAGQWQAAAWRLERKHPKKWGRYDRHEISGPDGGPLHVEFENALQRVYGEPNGHGN